MAIITWFTQPQNSFASYYYFDDTTHNFVRIRLELGRQDSGTLAMYRTNRYVGFSNKRYNTEARKKFFVDDGSIKTDTDSCLACCFSSLRSEVLQSNPQDGLTVYDFTSNDGTHPVGTPHVGNPVTTAPRLPNGISAQNLNTLALRCLSLRRDINLTENTATQQELVTAINLQIGNGRANATPQMSATGSGAVHV